MNKLKYYDFVINKKEVNVELNVLIKSISLIDFDDDKNKLLEIHGKYVELLANNNSTQNI